MYENTPHDGSINHNDELAYITKKAAAVKAKQMLVMSGNCDQ